MGLIERGKLKLAMVGMLRFAAGLAPDDSPAAAAALAKKHPPQHAAAQPLPADCPRFCLLSSSIMAALSSARGDSAPGLSGLPVCDLVRAFSFSSFEGALTLDLFFLVATHVTAGRACSVAGDVLEEFRKLFGKAVVLQQSAFIKAHFTPLQYGLVQGGVDFINLAIRGLRAAAPDAPIAALDIVNAYATLFRKATFSALNSASAEFRCLLPFWHSLYGVPRPLLFRSSHADDGFCYVDSVEGTAQGDPFAVFAYNFTIHPVLVSLFGPKGTYAGKIFCIAYADDITIAPWPNCTVKTFHADFNELVVKLAEIGSVVSTTKTVICTLGRPLYCLGGHTAPTLPNPAGGDARIPVMVSCVGWLCLGAPIGAASPAGDAFVAGHYRAVLASAVAKFNVAHRLMPTDTQHRFLILQACVSTSFSYLVRCCARDRLLMSTCAE
jgi:hypothetical protein